MRRSQAKRAGLIGAGLGGFVGFVAASAWVKGAFLVRGVEVGQVLVVVASILIGIYLCQAIVYVSTRRRRGSRSHPV